LGGAGSIGGVKISSLVTVVLGVGFGFGAFAREASLSPTPTGNVITPGAPGEAIRPGTAAGDAVKPAGTGTPAPKSTGSPTAPAPRDAKWLARHEGFVAEAKAGGIDVLFLGDSITDYWRNKGKATWDAKYAARRAANFGIGGDKTQNVLWRIRRGELDGISPKVIVLMLGTNNTGTDSPDDIMAGMNAVLGDIRKKCPQSKVLLLAIFPRNRANEEYRMDKIRELNARLAKLDDGGKTIRFLDISEKFLGPDGKVPADIMPDFLHPNAKGYEIWAEAMEPTLAEMLGETGKD
jgi:lysophospholipase L1-like esterase